MVFAMCSTIATLGYTIRDILQLRAQKQMVGIDACSHIAAMQHAKT
jgi:hypothetical protein